MSSLVITAHVHQAPALAEADLLALLEELGLEVLLDDAGHLLASGDSERSPLIAELHVYPLDGGRASQARLRLHLEPGGEAAAEAGAAALLRLLEASPLWCIDAVQPALPDRR